MSRIDENTELCKQLVKRCNTARENAIFSEKADAIAFNTCMIAELMTDISISLAVIADKLTGEREEV